MGYDLYGREPTSPDGTYFRRDIWSWPLLVCLCLNLTTSEARPCRRWLTNDGDGLNAAQSVKLASRLEHVLSDGVVARYLAHVRTADPASAEFIQESDVHLFVAFLKDCGGFSIH
jgi:hypothetical protein